MWLAARFSIGSSADIYSGRVNLDHVESLRAFESGGSWYVRGEFSSNENTIYVGGSHTTEEEALEAIASLVGGGAGLI